VRSSPAGQPLGLLGEQALLVLVALDEYVGQPVAQHVQAGIQLRHRLHHHPRPQIGNALWRRWEPEPVFGGFVTGVREPGTVQIPKIFPDSGAWRAIVPGIVSWRLVSMQYVAGLAVFSRIRAPTGLARC
jgi:hypothetical protein